MIRSCRICHTSSCGRKENIAHIFLQFLVISYGCFSSSFSLQKHRAFMDSVLRVVQINRRGFLIKEHSWKKQHAFFLFSSDSVTKICPSNGHRIASQVESANTWYADIWACSDNGCWYRARVCVSVQAVTFAPCNQWSRGGIGTPQRCLRLSA